MKAYFEELARMLYQKVPLYMYEILVIVLCLGTVLLLAIYGGKKGLRYLLMLILAEYVFLLFYMTVFIRTFNKKHGFDYRPFWSYEAFLNGQDFIIGEILMNIAVFVPLGLLLCYAFRRITWWEVLLIGGSVSVIIEILQLLFKRGFSEFDDVMHNVLGCMMGYGICKLVRYGYERIGKRSVGVL